MGGIVIVIIMECELVIGSLPQQYSSKVVFCISGVWWCYVISSFYKNLSVCPFHHAFSFVFLNSINSEFDCVIHKWVAFRVSIRVLRRITISILSSCTNPVHLSILRFPDCPLVSYVLFCSVHTLFNPSIN